MLIKQKKSSELSEGQVTSEQLYLNRRQIMKTLGFGAAAAALSPVLKVGTAQAQIKILKSTDFADGEEQTPFKKVTSYNNFYEFGTSKEDPEEYSGGLITDPWSVRVDGFAEKTGTFGLEDLIDFGALEERIYRLRCVEAWSMVIPWVGVPLSDVFSKLGPTSNAKFVRFETLADPSQMRGLRNPVLDWPYREGLRMDEAMHPLTFMAVGLYGKALLPQNGAPMRLVVPWKYGFKSIKSIVRISFMDRMPMTSWWQQNPSWYGFYSNVNP
ncbi:MAG: protein-methionine-sulfoxide reductase catalytic subunit MsrP, partial [Alphaproteobacteria bacterium]